MQREADKKLEQVDKYLRDDNVHYAREEALSYAFYPNGNKLLEAHCWYIVALLELYYPWGGEALRRSERVRDSVGDKKVLQDMGKMRIGDDEPMEDTIARKRITESGRSRRVWSTTIFDQATVLDHCQDAIDALEAIPARYDGLKAQLRTRIDKLIAMAKPATATPVSPKTSEEGLDELSSLLVSLAIVDADGDRTMTEDAKSA